MAAFCCMIPEGIRQAVRPPLRAAKNGKKAFHGRAFRLLSRTVSAKITAFID